MEGKGIERAPCQGRWVPCATPPALGQVRELLETLPVLLLLLVLCGLDWALYSIFDTIRRHSFLQYSFRSEPASPETPAPGSHPPRFFPFCLPLLVSAPFYPPQGQI